MSSCSHYDTRETKGAPSTENVKIMRNRYLSEPMKVDVEYMQLYTKAHKTSDGLNSFERRAHCPSPMPWKTSLLLFGKVSYFRAIRPGSYAAQFLMPTMPRIIF